MPLAAAIAAGLVAALFYLSVLTGSPGSLILVYLVQLPLFGVGLSLGVKALLVAGGTATLAASALSGLEKGVAFCLVEVAPVAFLVARALRRQPGPRGEVGDFSSSGALAVALVMLGASILAMFAAFLAGSGMGVGASVRGFIASQLAVVFETTPVALPGMAPGTALSADELADLVAPLFPAMAIGGWLLMAMLNGILAQGALARFALNRRPSPDIASLSLPRWLVIPGVACAVLAAFTEGDIAYVAANLLPILALAYVLAGLGVVHALLARYAARIFILIPAYVSLMLGWPILLLAACGIIDQWFGLRSRFAGAAPR